MAGKRALVVDDEKLIVKGIRFSLEQDEMQVDCAYDGEEALEYARNNQYDIILLDVMLPKLTGFEVCQQIREFSNVPIIMLTARGDDMDKILGLEYGADDYITKPFGVMELISRVKAMLRRSQKSQEKDKVLKLGNIVLDREKHSVTVGKEPVELTYKEYELLKLLMTNAGIVTTRELILDRVWGIDFEGESRTLDMHIKTLRQKLKEEGSLIKTVRNVGYIMNGEKV